MLQQLSEDKEVGLDLLPLVVALAFGACLGGQYTYLLSASTLTSSQGGQSVHSHLVWEVSQYTNVLLVHLHPVWEVSHYTYILSGRSVHSCPVSTLTSCLGGQSVHSHPV